MFQIRPIAAADRAAWDELWQGYQRFYAAEIPGPTSELTWQRLLDPAEPMHAALAWQAAPSAWCTGSFIAAAGPLATTATCRISTWPRMSAARASVAR